MSARPRPRRFGVASCAGCGLAGWRGAAGHLRRPHRPQGGHRLGVRLPWQRCTVHFLRDMLGHVARAQQPLVSGAIRGIFTAASAAEARQRLGQVVDQLVPHAAKVARLLEDAEADLLAFYAFPAEHWSKLRSTNPLERVNREIGRRTDVVGIFPNDAACSGWPGCCCWSRTTSGWLAAATCRRPRWPLSLLLPPIKTATGRRCSSSPRHDWCKPRRSPATPPTAT
jgi:hypothetical protein